LDREALSRQNDDCHDFVKALDTIYKGRQVIVSRKGLVVLAEREETTAVGLLNEVMAVLLFRSLPVCAIRETDLVECSIDMANKQIDGWKLSDGAANQSVMEERRVESGAARFYHPDNIRSFIQRAERMTSHPTVSMDLSLLLQAYTSHQESEFATSFLLSWRGVDRLLHARWRRLTKERQGDDGVEGATSEVRGNTGRVIEELHSCHAVDPSIYREAKKLYQKHCQSDQEVTIGESETCFRFFLSQLRRNLASEGPDGPEL
jgi:hypothetical protein